MNLTKGKGISLANCTCSWWKKKMIHELRSAVSTNSSQFLQLWLRKWRCCLVVQAPAPASGFCFEEVVVSHYRSCESKFQCIRLEVQPTFFIVWLTHRDGHRSRKKEGSFSFVDFRLGSLSSSKEALAWDWARPKRHRKQLQILLFNWIHSFVSGEWW